MKKYDIIAVIFWIGLSLFAMFHSYKLGIGGLRQPGPGLLPFYVGALILIISLSLLLRSVLKKGDKDETVKEDRSPTAVWKVVTVVISLTVYGVFLQKLGFLIATFILVNILFKTAGIKKWSSTLIGSVLTVLATYFLFTYLGLNFPKGILR
jgi:putative tricarboxylic transport membrane protein